MDVDEGDEEDGGRNFRPADHIDGKRRKICGIRPPRLGRGSGSCRSCNGLVDSVDCLANDVFCCGCQSLLHPIGRRQTRTN